MKMKKLIAFVLVCSLALGLTACARDNREDLMLTMKPNEVEPVTDLTWGSEAVTDFGVRLFQKTYEPEKNTLISPLSVLYALSMTANGAEGETLDQMEAVLGMEVEELNRWLGAYRNILTDTQKGKLALANSIWFRDTDRFTVTEAFLQKNADFYGGDIFKASFDEETCKDINSWVNKNTDGMIQNILNEIPDGAVMYLVNALAFEAQWQEIYKESAIWDGEFTTQRGFRRSVEMMHSEESLYLDDGRATGFLKYYEGGRYAFAALLPNEGITVGEYLENLTGEQLYALLSDPYEAKVQVTLPKFEAEYDVQMSDILGAMGMTDAFDGDKADLSGIGQSQRGNLYINRVLHKTYICVDGKGTKAGAATAVEVNDECAMVEPDFYRVDLDRPFIYLLIDTENRIPFFIGTMMDPDGEAELPEAEEPLSGPPELKVIWDGGELAARTGNYSWEVPAENGQNMAVIACGTHPLDNIDNREFTQVKGEWLELSFPVEPGSITIRRWPGEDMGNTEAQGTRKELDGGYLAMEEGEWVYQIVAKWDRDTWNGEAQYHLYLKR